MPYSLLSLITLTSSVSEKSSSTRIIHHLLTVKIGCFARLGNSHNVTAGHLRRYAQAQAAQSQCTEY